MNLVDYPDREFLMMSCADKLASALRAALGHEDRVTFAVPGGTTPGPVFDVLSAVDLDWARVDILPTDERWVAETSDRSNARLIRRRLLTGRAAAATFHPMWRDVAAPEAVLDRVTSDIAPLLPIDVLLLGMGEDMHTASIFPDADRLAEALAGDAPVLLPIRRPHEAEVRVTLSMPVLARALSVHLLITGQEKRAAVEVADRLPPRQAPVAGILGEATVHWAE